VAAQTERINLMWRNLLQGIAPVSLNKPQEFSVLPDRVKNLEGG
jgi:hypothetical protein